ncbi:RsmB/NOP family class I SAM-dependent RNA methyltransferase [Candidatus Woesearchaeota archaeon]|nr:RsmB/NOP family class I SAM-dependent RNA methyltransferase [Candidatus Woesearchaeota archaeon]
MDFLKKYELMGETFNPEKTKQKKALRINTLKITEQELIKRLTKKKVKLEKIKFLKHGYFYEADFSLASTQEYLQGYFYIQDAAAQTPAEVLNPEQEEIILDMAASPGGKCTQIAQLMKNKGIIIALEENKSRMQSLINNIERLSVTNTTIFKKDARFSQDLGIQFDKILLDAPCGGNFCVEKDYFKKRTQQDLDSKSRTQKELLRSAYLSLKKEGILIYSTCSLEPEENELVIDWFLKEFKEMKIVETNLNIGSPGITEYKNLKLNKDLKLTKRFWPHQTNTDGFFVARLKKWV